MSLEAFSGRWFVLKVGGELAGDPKALAQSVGGAVKAFLAAKVKVAVVHGGGPQASALQKKLGVEIRQVGGRRITDEATLEIMKMTLGGQVSVDVAASLLLAGVPALCTTGVSAGLVTAKRRLPKVVAGGGPEPVDFGLVGDVAQVDSARFEALSAAGFVPVVGSLCATREGQVLNVNADTVAAELAAALRAAKLFMVSNVPGVLANKDDPTTRMARLSAQEARARIASGAIQGGMIPKVEESLATLERGVGAVHVVGVSPPQALLDEAREPGSAGTAFVS